MLKHQPLVASYRKDYEWCHHLFASLHLNASGFLPPVVVVPSSDAEFFRKHVLPAYPGSSVKTSDVPPQYRKWVWADFMRAQAVMMRGDHYCPEADIVWLFGSDCFVNERLVPEQLMYGGLPVMPYSTYGELLRGHPACLCWRQGTTRALGFEPENEFMRRLPLLYPKKLYPQVRRKVAQVFGSSLDEDGFDLAIYTQGTQRNFSESNVLGAYAWQYRKDFYAWFLVDGFEYAKVAKDFPTSTVQFWSHGGLDKPCDIHHQFSGRTPRAVMDEFYAKAKAR